MRNLILTRTKSFVGCAVKLKVYISDPAAGELTIHNIPCRMLGTIKNGETMVFPISEAPARLFVIADKLSKDFCCEYCDLPEGSQDVALQGKCRFDPYGGNPFHFEGNVVPAKAKRRSWIIGISAVLAGVIIGLCATVVPRLLRERELQEPKVFSAEGMSITLTKAFSEMDATEYGLTLGYGSQDTALFILKNRFTDAAELDTLSVEEYARYFLSENGLTGSPYSAEGFTVYEYTDVSTADGQTYSYMIVFLKGPDAFWLFEFSTLESKADELRQTHLDYAKTITFSGLAI